VSEERLGSAKIQGVVLVIIFVERKRRWARQGSADLGKRGKGCFNGRVEFGGGEGETKKWWQKYIELEIYSQKERFGLKYSFASP
jgi:hypothetical protein